MTGTTDTVGKTLQRARVVKGISLRQAATGSKLAVNTIRRIEADSDKSQSRSVAIYAEFLGLDPNPLLDLFEAAS